MPEMPVRVTAPPDTYPWFLGLRTWWHEYVGSMGDSIPALLEHRPLRLDDRAATLRWRAHNAAQPAVCRCGQPGTVRVTSPSVGFVGDVAPYWWRCDEHADLPINTRFRGGAPVVETRDQCSWSISGIKTGIVSECGCGTHVGEGRGGA